MSTVLASSTTHATPQSATQLPWLFSARVDLLAFGGSFLASMILLLAGIPLGLTESETPDMVWIGAILLIDVAHVYATGFRVYFVPEELKRRPWLYGLTPVIGFVGAAVLYSQGAALFWRALAYLAVFHFVRQQYGWVALYRRREGDHDRLGWWIDASAIYMATCYPLIYWHAHPRNFAWFTAGDFFTLPEWTSRVAAGLYFVALMAYSVRAIYRARVLHQFNPGKDLVVITTVLLWYVGIVMFNSDYAFTITNVIAHGVPYLVLVYWYRMRWLGSDATQDAKQDAKHFGSSHSMTWIKYLAIVWVLAYAEEFLWDVGVWHERPWLFGSPSSWNLAQGWFVPLLAVPQITHYVLDGFVWRRSSPHRGE